MRVGLKVYRNRKRFRTTVLKSTNRQFGHNSASSAAHFESAWTQNKYKIYSATTVRAADVYIAGDGCTRIFRAILYTVIGACVVQVRSAQSVHTRSYTWWWVIFTSTYCSLFFSSVHLYSYMLLVIECWKLTSVRIHPARWHNSHTTSEYTVHRWLLCTFQKPSVFATTLAETRLILFISH